MEFELSDEQRFLQEAARRTRSAASRPSRPPATRSRAARSPDLWPTATDRGLDGPARARGPRRRRARRRSRRCSSSPSAAACSPACRCSATCPPARSSARPPGQEELAGQLASGETRAAYVPAPARRPRRSWTVEAAQRLQARRARSRLRATRCPATRPGCRTRPGADVLVAVDRRRQAVLVDRAAASIEAVASYDATRSLGHVTVRRGPATPLEVPGDAAGGAWYLRRP